jgi:hypothetical protein
MTPGTFPLTVCTVTRWALRTRGSQPPGASTRRTNRR